MMVIDSRPLVSYPYQHMEPDKEHFLGAQMDEWADKVFDIIDRDLSAQPLDRAPAVVESTTETVALATPAPTLAPTATPARAEPVHTPPIAARSRSLRSPIARAEPVAPEVIPRAEPVATPPVSADTCDVPTPAPTRHEPLLVRARLVFKSNPMPLRELLPYQESLVGLRLRRGESAEGALRRERKFSSCTRRTSGRKRSG